MLKLISSTLSDGGVHLHLMGKINGQELRFILDTGASHSVLDLEWIKEHKDEFSITSMDDPAHGIGASVEVHKTKVDSLELGDLSIVSYGLPLIDFTGINQIYANEGLEAVHGIIGGDILLKYGALIDYDSLSIDFLTNP